jgi:hypothetical protein
MTHHEEQNTHEEAAERAEVENKKSQEELSENELEDVAGGAFPTAVNSQITD